MHSDLRDILQQAEGIDALRRLVARIRPPKKSSTDEIDARIQTLVELLADDRVALNRFADSLRQALDGARLEHALAESGILPIQGFLRELGSRLSRRLLPQHNPEDIARHRLLKIFDDPRDWKWVTSASLEAWAELFSLVADSPGWNFSEISESPLTDAIRVLSQRIAALGVDEEFNAKIDKFDRYDSPFLDISDDSRAFVIAARDGDTAEAFQNLRETIGNCRDVVTSLRRNHQQVGTNLRLTKMTRRLVQQLDRLELLADLVCSDSALNGVICAGRLFRTIVEAEQTATSIGRLVAKSTDLVAYQVSEQGAKKGQKYITDTKSGYWYFLRCALQGGAIVAPFAIIKLWLAGQPLSLGARGFLYGANYAVCFMLLYLTGSILATKQPAVTASAIARKIDEATSDDDAVEGVADVVILVWRSQFVSFLGNLGAALPLGFGLAWGAVHWFGVELADGDKAAGLVDSVAPLASGALFYAAVAGVCLFLAGLISSAVDNHVVYAEIRRRIAAHPGLERLGDLRASIADFVSRHLGMITGNIALGFMLGIAGPLGTALGLPLDIRHIAFSSAELGIAGYTLPEIVTSSVGAGALIGVLGIGFMNFLICFVLTMGAGLDSRGLTFGQTRQLAAILLRRAVTRPWEWYLPTTKPRYELPESIPKSR